MGKDKKKQELKGQGFDLIYIYIEPNASNIKYFEQLRDAVNAYISTTITVQLGVHTKPTYKVFDVGINDIQNIKSLSELAESRGYKLSRDISICLITSPFTFVTDAEGNYVTSPLLPGSMVENVRFLITLAFSYPELNVAYFVGNALYAQLLGEAKVPLPYGSFLYALPYRASKIMYDNYLNTVLTALLKATMLERNSSNEETKSSEESQPNVITLNTEENDAVKNTEDVVSDEG